MAWQSIKFSGAVSAKSKNLSMPQLSKQQFAFIM